MRPTPTSLVTASVRRPWLTLAIGLVLTLGALFVNAQRMAMTTDTAALISSSVEWRQQEQRMEAAFPQLRDAMLIIVDGDTPERAEGATVQLAAKLAEDSAHFRRVTRPDGGDFFAREGLLYGSTDEVRSATRAMVDAQPLLGPLAADPSLRGVSGALSTMLDGVEAGETSLLALASRSRRWLARSTDRSTARSPAFRGRSSLRRMAARSRPTRRLILVQPVLDHSALMPGEAASAAVQSAAKALSLDSAHGVSVKLTGEVPLADEEFATLQENIGLVAIVMLGAMLLTLWLATRSVKLVGAIMITIIAGLIVTTAVGLLAIGRFNLISVAFIPLFVGLGVDFGIQICVRYNAERAEGAEPAARARPPPRSPRR
jgi:predicted exporter